MDQTQEAVKKAVIIKNWNSVRVLLEIYLRRELFAVRIYDNHLAALTELPQLTIKPDLMVIDLDSNNLSSIVTGLHSCCPSTRVIVLLDEKDVQVVEELRHLPNACILFKPFIVKQFLNLVQGGLC
ncbi:hypothetical protein [Tengunoibacter tsumagoiensis]|uniref:Response regulatory domain-containing protein n=1 Tax=Tengunoibacter tsumagoiensis TaxID=2014871 RepID=A0A402A7C6_9CHLR|nr:hypothetical protein [Tengunoibacter tsumagoiensis]GCE15042.1 hypothetical protein KTT_49010 [Tengunoibacter tsumagoiensis]